ncbi:MAG: NUDIX domain-containing protein [Fibrobacteres bacterium]|jgi:isopentenyldiphosphate isomerase|nr:NUDIX domain-containing protein [Fibrobacterota bacterium]
MADEMLIQVTDEDVVLGPIARSRVHGNPALIHRSVHVLVLGTDGRLLLQKRSLRKDTQPGKWDTSVGGHVGFGQSYEEAARREAAEELGLDLETRGEGAELIFLYPSRIRNPIESENIHTFLHVSAGPFRPEPDEIDELRFWTRSEIEAALGQGLFTSNFEEEFALFLGSPHARLLAP